MTRLEYLTDFYKNRSNKIANLNNHVKLERKITLKYLTDYIKENDVVVEIGAGVRAYTPELSKLNITITAVDLFDDYLKTFEKYKNVNTIQADIVNLKQIKDESFDVVFVNGALCHLFDKNEINSAINESIRICKQGGYILYNYLNTSSYIVRYGLIKGNLTELSKSMNKNGCLIHSSADIYNSYFVDDFKALFKNKKVKFIKDISTNGPFEMLKEYTNKLNEEEYKVIESYQMAICERKDMQGLSSHTITIYQKN